MPTEYTEYTDILRSPSLGIDLDDQAGRVIVFLFRVFRVFRGSLSEPFRELHRELAPAHIERARLVAVLLVDEAEPVNFLDLYFTPNPFNALASTIVPAVVVFSIALGAALIGVRGKERIIDDLLVIGEALSKLSGFVARLAPIGVFGIAAGTAGTMEFGELGRIQVYLILQALMALVMALTVHSRI